MFIYIVLYAIALTLYKYFVTPASSASGDGVKSSDTKTQQNKKLSYVIYPWKADILVIRTM